MNRTMSAVSGYSLSCTALNDTLGSAVESSRHRDTAVEYVVPEIHPSARIVADRDRWDADPALAQAGRSDPSTRYRLWIPSQTIPSGLTHGASPCRVRGTVFDPSSSSKVNGTENTFLEDGASAFLDIDDAMTANEDKFTVIPPSPR